MLTPCLYLEKYGIPARERLAQLIAEAKSDDALAPITVVVPTQYAGLSLRRSLNSKNGLVNIRFMIAPRLAEYLGSPRLAEKGKTPLSPIMELAAIRHFARDMHGHGPLGNVAEHPKLHSSLRYTFRDLDRLSEAELDNIEAIDPLRAQIVKWYRLFRDLLRNHYDREELSLAAAAALKEGTASSILKDLGFIIFHLVPDFSPGELAMVAALSDTGKCAAILGLSGEPESDVLTLLTANRLKPCLGETEPPREISRESNTVHHLLIAPDAQEEIRWIIRHIIRQAEEGLPFHRMAILYRQRDPYAFLVQSQLRLAGIPVAGPDATSLRDTPAGKLLVYLLEAIGTDFARTSVMRWIAEAPVKSSIDGELASKELAHWEVISRELGIIKGASQWQERLTRYSDGLDKRIGMLESLEEASPAQLKGLHKQRDSAHRLALFIKDLLSISPPSNGSLWSAYAKWAGDLVKKYAHHPTGWPQEHQNSYERIITLLDELKALDDLIPGGTDLANFHLILNDILESPSGRSGLTGAGVFVAPVAAAQAMDFEIVYIVGMTEGAFPPAVPDDPVLPDRLRKTLPGTENLPLRQSRRIEERRHFLAALAAGQKQILSYPRADSSSQRGQYPSPWFVAEASRLHNAPVSSDGIEKLESEQWLSLIHSSQHSLEYASSLAPADNNDYDMSSIARWRERNYSLERHFLMKKDSPGYRALQMEKGRRGSNFTVWDGRLSELVGKSRRLGLPQNNRFSPTRLERWAVCPFRYFLGDVLGISALERPEELMTISPLNRGALLHQVMERLVNAARKAGCLPDFGQSWNQSHREMLMKIAEEEFEKAEASGITGHQLLWEIAKEEMRQDLIALLETDSRWRIQEDSRPLWVERQFGFARDNNLPPVVITLTNGAHVSLRGLIDRVDENPSRSKIIVMDYKFGSAFLYRDMNKDPLGGGRHLQLPVYALAASNALGKPAEVIALYWFATAKGKFEKKIVSLSEVETRFQKMVEIIASGIEQGLFPANPGSTDNQAENCQYCDFDRICPANRDLLWERKSQSPELATYLKLGKLEPEQEDKQ